jgi:ribosomal protein S18 acetylase RimI-like enzyme
MICKVAELHLDTFKIPLGIRHVRNAIEWFFNIEQAIALVGIDAKAEVVGYVAGAPLEFSSRMGRDLRWSEAVAMIMRPWLLFNGIFRNTLIARFKRAFRRFQTDRVEPALPELPPKLPELTMVLMHIAISPSARGMGVGLHLMQAFEAKARELKMRALLLSVNKENKVARQLYEKCGWQVFSKLEDKKEMIDYTRFLF